MHRTCAFRQWTAEPRRRDYRATRSPEVLPPIVDRPVLRIPLHPSRHAALALGWAHALAAAALAATGMSPVLSFAGVLVLGVHAVIQIRRHAGQAGPAGVLVLELSAPGGVRLVRADRRHDDWEIADVALVSPVAVLLHLRHPSDGRRSLWVPGDACDPDGHRRLRVRLRWRTLSETPDPGRA